MSLQALIQAADFLEQRPRTRAYSKTAVGTRKKSPRSSIHRSPKHARTESKAARVLKTPPKGRKSKDVQSEVSGRRKRSQRTEELSPKKAKDMASSNVISNKRSQKDRSGTSPIAKRRTKVNVTITKEADEQCDFDDNKREVKTPSAAEKDHIYFTRTNVEPQLGTTAFPNVSSVSNGQNSHQDDSDIALTLGKSMYEQLVTVEVQHVEEIATSKLPAAGSLPSVPKRKQTHSKVIGTGQGSESEAGRWVTDRDDSNTGSYNREVHNTLEKNRRANLKRLFEYLKAELNIHDEKLSNLNLLRYTVQRVVDMRKSDAELMRIKLELLSRQDYLTNQIRALATELSGRSSQSVDDPLHVAVNKSMATVNDLLIESSRQRKQMAIDTQPARLGMGTLPGISESEDGSAVIVASSPSTTPQKAPAVPTDSHSPQPGSSHSKQPTDRKQQQGGGKKPAAYQPYVRHFILPATGGHRKRQSASQSQPAATASPTVRPATPPTGSRPQLQQQPQLVVFPPTGGPGSTPTARLVRPMVPVILGRPATQTSSRAGATFIQVPGSVTAGSSSATGSPAAFTTSRLVMSNGKLVEAQIAQPALVEAAPTFTSGVMLLSNGKLINTTATTPTAASASTGSVKFTNSPQAGKATPAKGSAAQQMVGGYVVLPSGIGGSSAAVLPGSSGAQAGSSGGHITGVVSVPRAGGSGQQAGAASTTAAIRLDSAGMQALLTGKADAGLVEINNVKYLAVPITNKVPGLPTGLEKASGLPTMTVAAAGGQAAPTLSVLKQIVAGKSHGGGGNKTGQICVVGTPTDSGVQHVAVQGQTAPVSGSSSTPSGNKTEQQQQQGSPVKPGSTSGTKDPWTPRRTKRKVIPGSRDGEQSASNR